MIDQYLPAPRPAPARGLPLRALVSLIVADSASRSVPSRSHTTSIAYALEAPDDKRDGWCSPGPKEKRAWSLCRCCERTVALGSRNGLGFCDCHLIGMAMSPTTPDGQEAPCDLAPGRSIAQDCVSHRQLRQLRDRPDDRGALSPSPQRTVVAMPGWYKGHTWPSARVGHDLEQAIPAR